MEINENSLRYGNLTELAYGVENRFAAIHIAPLHSPDLFATFF